MREPLSIQEKIIKQIIKNRISTTEIADCLNKTGALPGVSALNRGHFRVGPVYFAYAYGDSNWELHEQLENPPEGSIVVIETLDCNGRSPIGNLIVKFLMLYRQVAGVVVRAPVRDAHQLIKENWPVWSAGVSPIGCHNLKNEHPADPERIAALRAPYEGALAVCDDTGVVLIPAAVQTEEFRARLDWIEEQEDIWFDCIDRRKWTTYETVCLKKYLNESR